MDAIYLLVIIIDKSVRHSCIHLNPRKYFVNRVTVQLIKTTLKRGFV